MGERLLRTDRLTVGYNGVPLLRDITLNIEPGEILTLIGPNGAGKSTILKSILRQLEPLGGTVYLTGKPMGEMTGRETARHLSAMMTERTIPELMSCEEVVGSGRYPYTGRLGILSSKDRTKVQEALELTGTYELAERDFSHLSDGQRQRVLLARAICQEPDVIILDEPTSFLDIRYKLELLEVLKKMVNERRLAVIMSLHELDLAQKISDRVLCVREGKIDRCGPPDEIFSDGYIRELYGVKSGSYDEFFGCLELQAVVGEPQVFVIGGSGSGLSIYRQLQRKSIPFAAGILYENDIEFHTASTLASEVISARAFYPIDKNEYQRALSVLKACERVICCLKEFGPFNHENQMLAEYALRSGKLTKQT